MNERTQQALENFKAWLKEEDDKKHSSDVANQTNYRERQYDKDWLNAAFFGPPSAIEYIKGAWEAYKKDHAHLWTDVEDNSG